MSNQITRPAFVQDVKWIKKDIQVMRIAENLGTQDVMNKRQKAK